jgi:hypothetical protein
MMMKSKREADQEENETNRIRRKKDNVALSFLSSTYLLCFRGSMTTKKCAKACF